MRPTVDAFDEADIPIIEAMSAKLEGKTQEKMNPHPQGSLAYASWVCARLGGWNCYYGKPGPVVMLEGGFQLQAATYGARITIEARRVNLVARKREGRNRFELR